MSLSERIQIELVQAMKAKDTVRLGVLRLIKSAFQNKAIELRATLTQEQELQVLKTMLKQRMESVEMFDKGGREDLSSKELAEAEILKTYLPAALGEDEIERVVEEVAAELGASSPKQMGRVMKETMNRLQGAGKMVDGKLVNQVVRRKLSS